MRTTGGSEEDEEAFGFDGEATGCLGEGGEGEFDEESLSNNLIRASRASQRVLKR